MAEQETRSDRSAELFEGGFEAFDPPTLTTAADREMTNRAMVLAPKKRPK